MSGLAEEAATIARVKREIEELNGKLDTVRDILGTADASSKAFVDEFVQECRQHESFLQGKTEYVLGANLPGDEGELLFSQLVDTLEKFNALDVEYNQWSAKLLAGEIGPGAAGGAAAGAGGAGGASAVSEQMALGSLGGSAAMNTIEQAAETTEAGGHAVLAQSTGTAPDAVPGMGPAPGTAAGSGVQTSLPATSAAQPGAGGQLPAAAGKTAEDGPAGASSAHSDNLSQKSQAFDLGGAAAGVSSGGAKKKSDKKKKKKEQQQQASSAPFATPQDVFPQDSDFFPSTGAEFDAFPGNAPAFDAFPSVDQEVVPPPTAGPVVDGGGSMGSTLGGGGGDQAAANGTAVPPTGVNTSNVPGGQGAAAVAAATGSGTTTGVSVGAEQVGDAAGSAFAQQAQAMPTGMFSAPAEPYAFSGADENAMAPPHGGNKRMRCVMRLSNLRLSDIEHTIGREVFAELFRANVAQACGVSAQRIRLTSLADRVYTTTTG